MTKYCAPGKGDKFTCFSLNSLKKIADSWNTQNPDKIQYTNNKKKLWNQLSEKFRKVSKCKGEWCWLDSDILKNLNSDEIQNNTFRPRMPVSWKKKKNTWLSTIDIAKVLEQYHKQHKDFQFIGPVPIDFDKKLSPGICVVNELCKLNIKKLYNNGKRKLGIVFNLDPHTSNGSHWVCMFCNFNTGGIYYFDSYGYKPNKEISQLLKRIQIQGNNMISEMGLPAFIKMKSTHEIICNIQPLSKNKIKLHCPKVIKYLYINDLVGLGNMRKDCKKTNMCKKIKDLRTITHIDYDNNIVTFNKPFNQKYNLLIHRGFKIFINEKRHQYKDSECGMYCIYFITKLLSGETFKNASNKLILDDKVQKYRFYFYRPNIDNKEQDWLEYFK